MALFGRRKPGFSKEVELKPEEIPGEFSDALDPAVNKDLDNPKAEKLEYQHNAEHVINGEQASTAEKPDLLDYLESLPDVEDPFPPSEPEEAAPGLRYGLGGPAHGPRGACPRQELLRN